MGVSGSRTPSRDFSQAATVGSWKRVFPPTLMAGSRRAAS